MGVRISMAGAAARKRRTALKNEFWPKEIAWQPPDEVGYFNAPRTLSLVLCALRLKSVSDQKDPSLVYVDLLSNQMGEGVVELGIEEDHAFACGYTNARTWRDRMKVLEDAGFIKASSGGNRNYARVLIIHPTVAMQGLYESGKLSKTLWETYRARQIAVKEPAFKELVEARTATGAS